MKSTVDGDHLFEVPDSLPHPILPLIPNVGFIGILNSPPSLENVQFLPITEGGSSLPSVLQAIPDPTKISSKQANFTNTFLKSVLTSIDSKDPVVANAWLETLLDVIDLLPKEVVREEILTLAVSKGQCSQESARLASCKLIGKISTKFEPFILKSEILGIVQCLCQDVSGEVRGSMCMQLAAVAKGVGLNTTKSLILPELVDLCSDEEVNVRLAGINTVVQMLPLVDQETRSDTLVPLVKKVCERSLRVEDVTLPVTAHLLGRICHGLHDDLTKEQKDFFINYYCTLSKLGLPDAKKTDLGLPMPDLVAEVKNGEYEAECRQQCAYNFPAMVLFAGGPTGYRKHLHDILISFVTDPSLPVRNTIALSFHQLCTLIGSEVGILRESFLNLLRSENLEVVAALVPNISHILAAFNHHQVLTQSSLQTEVLDLVGALKQGEESLSKSSNWRVHSEILRQIAALALCLPADLLFSEVVPLMIHRMHTSRPIPCRQAAARTLLVFLRHMDTEEHRDHINKTLVIEFCEANSCHKRMLFLSVCQMALELLPLSSFKHSLFEPLLALHTDSVPNIRLKVVSFLPILKGILSLPEDRQRLQDLETAVGSLLMKESDKDVSALITEVIGHLDKIEVSESKRESPEGQEMSNGISDAYAERRVMERDKSKGGTEDASNSLPNKEQQVRPSSGINGSNRRVASPRKIPSYVVAQRRKSHNFAPELPPDEKAVKRGYWNPGHKGELDLSALCDEVLLSPEEPTSINWEDIVDITEDMDDKDFPILKDELVSDFPSVERHVSIFSDRARNEINKSEKATRKSAKERFLESVGSLRFENSKSLPYESSKSLHDQNSKNRHLKANYEEGTEASSRSLTPRQRFWMKTSRPKWRRKVASADTSPEEPRRSRFSRGNSTEGGRTCFSDTEDPDMRYNFESTPLAASVTKKKFKFMKPPPVSVASSNIVNHSYDVPSPTSPHGMYTWPPQHNRHRQHGSFEDEEDTVEHNHQLKNSDFNDNGDELVENYDDDLHCYERVKPSVSAIGQNKSSKENSADASFSSKQRQKSLSSHNQHYENSQEYFNSSNRKGGSYEKDSTIYKSQNPQRPKQFSFPQKPHIPDPFNYHPNRRPVKASNKENISKSPSLNAVNKSTLSLLLSATPKSSKLYEDAHLSSGYDVNVMDERQSQNDSSEDLYAVHGIPPTMPRKEVSSGRARPSKITNSRTFSSFPHDTSDDTFSPFLSYSDTNLTNPYFSDYSCIPSDNKADLSYKEIRYHLAAAAAAAEQEWRESRRYDYRDNEYRCKGHDYGGDISPSYVLLDSVELAPWSTSPAYPIGPLGASWLQHGLTSHNRHPYFIPPPLMRNRSLPSHSFPSSTPPSHSFLSFSSIDNQWPHHSSLRSISSLDPSADEFLIDAGVRIDEASFCSRIPPPSNRVPQRSRIIGPFNRHLQSNVSSRSRGPSGNISKIPVVGRNSESLSSPPPLNTNSSPSVDVKTRQRVNQRHNRPVSSISTLPPTRISIGGSRGKSLSHENLRSSARIGMSSSSSAKTSPVSSRPSSPNRISAMVSRGRQSHPNNARRPSRNVGNSPSGSRCSSPGSNDVEGGRNRRGSSATSSPSTSRCPSPGIEDAPRGNIQKRVAPTSRINSQGRTRTVNVTVPNVSGGGSARGRGSKLPLPTSKK
ncbi:UNVERIFIED_CONTAM: hypothetical protein RMT77_018303 [Armadillidium vulgare]